MKVFVFTYDRFDSITTSMALEKENIDHTVICHTEKDKIDFYANGRVLKKRLVASGNPKGLAYNRNFALDLMEEGEWAVFLVDDWIRAEEVEGYDLIPDNEVLPITIKNTTEWNKKFQKKISIKKFIERCKESSFKADALGYALVGFCLAENPLFRKQKYKTWALADGRAWVVKKTHLRFDENVQLVDDSCWTALNLEAFGGVLIDQWILPKCRRYTKGSFGSIQKRMPQKIKECKYLTERYSKYIQYGEKKGWPSGSHVRLKNRKTVESL